MTVIQGKLLGHPDPTSVRVTAVLVDLNGDRRSGYVATAEGELHYPLPATPAGDGTWELDLVPNTSIETGWGESLWLVTEGRVPQYGRTADTYLSVPDTPGPVWMGDLRVDPPGGAAQVLEAAATAAVSAHLAAEDPHGDRADAAATYMTLTAGDTLTDRTSTLETQTASLDTTTSSLTDRATALETQTGTLETRADGLEAAVAPVLPRVTVTEWMADRPFRAAHRGGGHEGPEHTMQAYSTAVAQGALAIEVSVQLTADGVLVCWHDTTLARMTDSTWPGAIGDYTWYELKERVHIQAWPMLGPGWSDVEITRLDDVLDRFLGRVVILLEAKTPAAVVPMEELLLSGRYDLGLLRSTVIIKGYGPSLSSWAHNNGFKAWGYFNAGETDSVIDAHESKLDMLGMPHTTTDQRLLDVLNRPAGLPLMVWEVHRWSEIERLSHLTGTGAKTAVDGYMVSDWAYLATPPPHDTSSVNGWATQIKKPGDLGHANYDPTYALKFDAEGGVFGNIVPNLGWLLGSRSHLVPPASYRIAFELMLEGIAPAGQHCGIAFGRQWDDKYEFNGTNQTSYQAVSPGGYHLVLRCSTGNMRLYKHVAGQTSGIPLNDAVLGNAETPTVAPVAGAWMSFEIDVSPTQLVLRRTDTGTVYSATYTDSEFRGGFLHLSNGSVNSLGNKPHLRNLTVTEL